MNEATRTSAGHTTKTNHNATIAMVLMLALATIGGIAVLLLFSR